MTPSVQQTHWGATPQRMKIHDNTMQYDALIFTGDQLWKVIGFICLDNLFPGSLDAYPPTTNSWNLLGSFMNNTIKVSWRVFSIQMYSGD